MTNTPTIDGVSRELRKRLEGLTDKAGGMFVSVEELRALLDAPAVGRQSVSESIAAMVTEWVEGGIRMGTDWRNGLPGIIQKRLARFGSESPTCAKSQVDQLIAECWKACGGNGPATREDLLTALRMMNEAEDESDSAIAQLQGRIAELESGRGEAAGYLYACPEDEYQQPEIRLADFRVKIIAKGWIETPLYTAPQAPVAQKLGEPTAYLRNEGVPNNLVVCPFDHPDAFKVYRVPSAPVAVVLPARADAYTGSHDAQRGWDSYGEKLIELNPWIDATAALNEGRK